MSFRRAGLDFLGGGLSGFGEGAAISAGLKTAGFAVSPWTAGALMLGVGGLKGLGNVLGGMEDSKAEKMNFRLGEQELELNEITIDQQRREAQKQREEEAKRKQFASLMSGIFSRYGAIKGAGAKSPGGLPEMMPAASPGGM